MKVIIESVNQTMFVLKEDVSLQSDVESLIFLSIFLFTRPWNLTTFSPRKCLLRPIDAKRILGGAGGK